MNAPKPSAREWNRQGVALVGAGRLAEAAGCFRNAIRLDRSLPEPFNNLGAALVALQRYRAALPVLHSAVSLQPQNADTHFNLGIASWQSGRADLGIAHFEKAIALKPDLADAYYNLGILLAAAGRYQEAIRCFSKVAELQPSFAPAHHNLGAALICVRRYDEAIASLGRLLELDPGNAEARAQRMHLLAGNCDWDALKPDLPLLPQLGVSQGIAAPFGLLAFEDEPDRHLIRAQRFAQSRYAAVAAPIAAPAARPAKLKIGYFSGDFHEHAVMQVAAPLFESHDRQRFIVEAYSYGPPADDPMRRRLVEAFDQFHNIAGMTDQDIAAKARADGVDVAVDLQGHTLDTRLGIFAHRAAPLQMTHLGFPGSSGAPFMDYLVADRTLIPHETRDSYTESLLILPNSYQPNGKRRIARTKWTRAKAGLPASGFIFCCFNNSYKIGPREFDIWMDLLRRVNGSVLWLVAQNDQVKRNLGKEAARRGIAPERLIFAPRLPLDEYLARQRLADLSLDTFAYTGHSTSSDTLWAGVPLVTRLGRGFPARVSASLLRALGLEELVTHSDADYAALAYELATDPKRLAGIGRRLAQSLTRSPLYDVELYARHLEAGYDAAFARLVQGQPPADIVVPA